jgi:hypothetical protein
MRHNRHVLKKIVRDFSGFFNNMIWNLDLTTNGLYYSSLRCIDLYYNFQQLPKVKNGHLIF